MGSQLKRLIIAIISLSLTAGPAFAATKSPSPKSTVKSTVKSNPKSSVTPTTKMSAKPTAKATSKTTSKASTKVSAKPTVKATAKATAKATSKTTATKKAVVKKTPVKKKSTTNRTKKLPPEKPEAWPPKGFAQNGDIFARNPTPEEVYLAAGKDKTGNLAKQLAECEKFICGTIFVGSAAGCQWWEINSEVYGPASETDNTRVKLGDLKSLFKGSAAKKVTQLVLISEVPFDYYSDIFGIKIACHREPIPADLQVPSNTYVKVSVTG